MTAAQRALSPLTLHRLPLPPPPARTLQSAPSHASAHRRAAPLKARWRPPRTAPAAAAPPHDQSAPLLLRTPMAQAPQQACWWKAPFVSLVWHAAPVAAAPNVTAAAAAPPCRRRPRWAPPARLTVASHGRSTLHAPLAALCAESCVARRARAARACHTVHSAGPQTPHTHLSGIHADAGAWLPNLSRQQDAPRTGRRGGTQKQTLR